MLQALVPFLGLRHSLDLVPVSSTFPIAPQLSSEGLTRLRPTSCLELQSFAVIGVWGVVVVALGFGVRVGVSVVAGRFWRR